MRLSICAFKNSSSSELGDVNTASPASARAPSRIAIVASPPSSESDWPRCHLANQKYNQHIPNIRQVFRLFSQTPARPIPQWRRPHDLALKNIASDQRISAKRYKRLNQHCGLHGHMQTASDTRALWQFATPNSSRNAIKPGISVSAIVVLCGPNRPEKYQ